MVKPLASLTIENFWTEDVKQITYVCYANFFIVSHKTFYNVQQKQIIIDADLFTLNNKVATSWSVDFITQSGSHWVTSNHLQCDDFKDNNGQVTIGINGDAQTMYVAFPSSKSCSIKLIKT